MRWPRWRARPSRARAADRGNSGGAGRGAAREVRVRTRLTPTSERHIDSLCVMFLQDLRELEARIRTEKLAAMGRMSAAVAHEIRNPLAAITQASALLAEDLTDPAHRKLTSMVQHNAQRLARIVDDVLDVSRARQQQVLSLGEQVVLDPAVQVLADEWVRQTQRKGVRVARCARQRCALRRRAPASLLVNLLDNASRYAASARARSRCSPRRSAAGTNRPALRYGATARRWSRRCSGTCSSPSFRPRAAPAGLACSCAASCAAARRHHRLRAPGAGAGRAPRATNSSSALPPAKTG
jgi:hypothetical protein